MSSLGHHCGKLFSKGHHFGELIYCFPYFYLLILLRSNEIILAFARSAISFFNAELIIVLINVSNFISSGFT